MNKIDYRVTLYEEIRQAPPEKVKQLDQKEREVVLIALRSLRYKESAFHVDQSQLSSIIEKLKSASIKPISKDVHWYQQWRRMIASLGKGILNLLNLRTSSHQILKETHQITIEKQELEKISADIQQKKAELKKCQEELQETPYFLYKDLLKVYDDLPEDIQEAQLGLDDEIEKRKEKLKAAKNELGEIEQTSQTFKLEAAKDAVQRFYEKRKQVLKEFIDVLENDILKSLENLRNPSKDRLSQDRFIRNLMRKKEFLMRQKTGKFNSSIDNLEKKISKLEKEIGKLEKRQEKLQERLNDNLVG
jgi:flagellar capping protein FliD